MTKAVFNDLFDRIQRARENLGSVAGIDPLQDRYVAGAISAYTDMLHIEFEDTKND